MPALMERAARLNEAARVRAHRRYYEALASVPVPVVVERLSCDAEVVEVTTIALEAIVPGGVWALDAFGPDAATRALLASEVGYGPIVRRVVLVTFIGDPLTVQELTLVGQLSAVERTVPDRMTRDAWGAVGVEGLGAVGMPVVKQMERR